jgi:membrane protein insertase Oxa1/YidC/SpoIIIJ
MYTIYIEQPLHNLFLWFVSLTPNNNLFLGLALLALFVKLIVFVFVYHGHLNNIKHHFIKGHVDELHKKHKDNRAKFSDELHNIYEHYSFNPWSGIFIVLIQFVIFFAILNFLYSGVNTGFNRLDIVTMDNVFVASSMDMYFAGMNLLKPLVFGWFLIAIGLVQFLSLEIYLLTKRKIHRHSTHEEKVEHLLNLIIAVIVSTIFIYLPAVFAAYWFFYILFGIIRKLFFDIYIDKHILKKLEKIKDKIEKKEEPKIRNFDRTFLFLLWKIFHSKTNDKEFSKMIKSIEKKLYSSHHFTYLRYSQKKMFEEPYTVALIVFFIFLLSIALFK